MTRTHPWLCAALAAVFAGCASDPPPPKAKAPPAEEPVEKAPEQEPAAAKTEYRLAWVGRTCEVIAADRVDARKAEVVAAHEKRVAAWEQAKLPAKKRPKLRWKLLKHRFTSEGSARTKAKALQARYYGKKKRKRAKTASPPPAKEPLPEPPVEKEPPKPPEPKLPEDEESKAPPTDEPSADEPKKDEPKETPEPKPGG